MLEETRVCLWCGTELNPAYEGLYCTDSHRTRQQRHRKAAANFPVHPCPHPEKVAFTHRGPALRKAVERQQYPYLCRCACFHLTSRPNNDFDDAIRMLVEEMSLGVTA